ncbi:MAG: TolC family protein [Spirochaetales bacterium]|nr:TolC family protein [Spirochaetales bacterium]
MKKTVFIILFFFSILSLGAQGTVLDARTVVDLVKQNNAVVRISSAGEELARQVYQQVLGSGRPMISFATDSFGTPLYGYGNRSASGFGVPLVEESHTFAGSLSLSSLLPTGGRASLSVDNSLRVSRPEDGDTWTYNQDPGVGITLFQPIFTNGKFIDGSILSKTRRNAEALWESSRTDSLHTLNGVLLGTFRSLHQIETLRRQVELLKRGVDLAVIRRDVADEDRSRGRISESDLLEIELQVGKQRESLFDASYRLTLSELDTAGLLGLENLSSYTYRPDYREVESLLEELGRDIDTQFNDVSGNPSVLQASLDKEQRELALSLNGLDNAPTLGMGFLMGPRYPDTREDENAFLPSLSELFSSDAGVDVSFGLSVSFDLWDGGVAASRRKADEAALTMASEALMEARRTVQLEVKNLITRMSLLNQRISLLEENIEIDSRLLQREEQLLALGTSTAVNVETVRLALLNRQAEVQNLLGERFLLGLQFLSLTGQSIESFLTE